MIAQEFIKELNYALAQWPTSYEASTWTFATTRQRERGAPAARQRQVESVQGATRIEELARAMRTPSFRHTMRATTVPCCLGRPFLRGATAHSSVARYGRGKE
jgi:hypothetical protein